MSLKAMSIVWDQYRTGGSEKLILLALADWCNDAGESLHPSLATIARKACLTVRQTRRIMASFIEQGLLEVIGNYNGGAPGTCRHYRLRLDRVGAEDTGDTEDTDDTEDTHVPRRRTPATERGDMDVRQSVREPSVDPSENSTGFQPVVIAGGKAPDDDLFGGAGRLVKPNRLPCPAEKLVDLYHQTLPQGRQCLVLTKARRTAITARWREYAVQNHWQSEAEGLDFFREYFAFCSRSKWLTGRASGGNGRPFEVGLDWLMKAENWAKTIEGKYHNG